MPSAFFLAMILTSPSSSPRICARLLAAELVLGDHDVVAGLAGGLFAGPAKATSGWQ